jgi:hypothetical protein
VVSVGVLTVLGVLGFAGALVVGGGGGSSGSASGFPVAARTSPSDWTAATVAPGAGGSATPDGSTRPSDDDVAGALAEPSPTTASANPSTAAGAAGGAAAVPEADRSAGVATTRLVQSGTGRLVVVPGSAPAPSPAPVMKVRIEVEDGIGADGPAFAAFVMKTLNDSRGWGHGGTLTFARTSGPADIRVILASPDASERLCAPAQTRGTMSCGGGDRAVLTMYRWMNGIPDYGDDRTAYRQYLVNHEVGHVLGHAHAYCDPGHLAPVMVQQTKGLQGCLPNAWPFPTTS